MCPNAGTARRAAEHDVQPREADENHAKPRRQYVSLARPAVDRFLAVQEVDHDEYREIEYTAAHDVADGDVGRSRHGDGAYARNKLWQRRDRCHEDESDPASPKGRSCR